MHGKLAALMPWLLIVGACSQSDSSDSVEGNQAGGNEPPMLAATFEQAGAATDPVRWDRSSDLKGPDTNANGIRDDIDAWLGTLSIAGTAKSYLEAQARTLQQVATVDLTSTANLSSLNAAYFNAVMCNDTAATDLSVADLQHSLLHYTFNTKDRFRRYLDFDASLSQFSVTQPEAKTC
ncbi:MAG TPA: hypothetical protein VI168_06230 [Croceibacterium sp.]